MEKAILQSLELLPTISLEEMSGIRLMNRTDRKYLATLTQLERLLEMARGKYYVNEIDGRLVSPYRTVYLDTPDEEMYLAHHNGRLTRQKVRVRTYLNSNETFLEVKNKNNHGRTKKKRMQVQGLDTLVQDGGNELLNKYAWYTLEQLVPKVENQFERITLVNMEKTERLTIDSHVRFHHWETGVNNTYDRLVIIELKRDGNVYSPVLDILRTLRIHPSGFSKYCIGTVATNKDIKKNNFLPKVRRFEKLLENEFINNV